MSDEILSTGPGQIEEAIGRFVVSFSRLEHHLELAVVSMVSGGIGNQRAKTVLYGERGPEAGRTFTVFRHLALQILEGDANDAEGLSEIVKATSKELQQLTKFRNDVSHGSWHVGSTKDGRVEFDTALLLRAKAGGSTESIAFDAETLLVNAERCEVLAIVGFQMGLNISLPAPDGIKQCSDWVRRNLEVVDGIVQFDRLDARSRARG